MLSSSNIALVVAAAAVALVAFAVVRGLWRVFSGAAELDAGGSWGRQTTSAAAAGGHSWKTVLAAAACFVVAFGVVVFVVLSP